MTFGATEMILGGISPSGEMSATGVFLIKSP
jgi:hypothetical protein